MALLLDNNNSAVGDRLKGPPEISARPNSTCASTDLSRFTSPFKPKRVVVLSKQSMLEYELYRLQTRYKRTFTGTEDHKFLKELKKRHANIEDMKKRHRQQQSYVTTICDELSRHGIEFKVVNRHTYTDELVSWSDLIISAGGDGTFLTAATKVRNDVPVIGINTDPFGSEGHLCLTGKSNRPADEVIRQFLNNDFRWTHRQRIRVTLVEQEYGDSSSSSTSSSSSLAGKTRSIKNIKEYDDLSDEYTGFAAIDSPNAQSKLKKFKFNSDDESENSDSQAKVGGLPHLALNEVFIGESHAARVSYYDVQLDDGALIKQKSSGMTICTGTGSTSWHYNINRLTEYNLKEILEIAGSMGFSFAAESGGKCTNEIDDGVVEVICKRFNQNLIFEPEAKKMAFSIRDPVFNATFSKTMSRGFAHRIRLKSRCTHAHLILDGSTPIPFNRGAEVVLDIHPEDALRTVILL